MYRAQTLCLMLNRECLIAEVYATIRSMLPGVQYHGGARMLLYTNPDNSLPKVEKLPGHVAIVCGSGADVQMAYEAKVALQLQGGYSTMIKDISPTKLGQLLSRREQLQAADAVIVCCGEQPALAGLILGLVDVPVVAIPGVQGRPDPSIVVSVPGMCLLRL
jgi:pyridinium-3,5-biscarboxylic acid mononucleotide synthase